MNKRIFTKEEIEYIKNNWGKESAYSMKKKFNCTWYAVVNQAVALGFEAPKSNAWTKEEVESLKSMSKTMHYSVIAKRLEKTENAVYLKAKKLGITLIMDRREWTHEEEEILKELWGDKKIELIAKKLKRSIFSIKVKAVRMKLGAMILSNVDIITISDICELFDVTRDMVTISWKKKGLIISNVSVSNKKSYQGVKMENLMRFLEQNQEIWDSNKLEKNILGSEPEWLLIKRQSDLDKVYHKYTFWTEEEKTKAKFYIQQGKDYDFIAERVNHSSSAVADYLRSEGFIYKLPKYWNSKDIKFVKDHRKDLTVEEIAKKLNRTLESVIYMEEILNFEVMGNFDYVWTEEDDEYLKIFYTHVPNYEIANLLGVSREMLIDRLKFLGIYKGTSKHIWTLEEDSYILENYQKKSYQDLASYCGVCKKTLINHMEELNVYKEGIHKWTQEEDDYILNHYKKLSNVKIASTLDVSLSALYYHLKIMGLSKKEANSINLVNSRKELLITLKKLLQMKKQEDGLVLKK